MLAKWQTMSECRDNQEVGLEAATLKRVRNSSLVKCSGADNSTGLKLWVYRPAGSVRGRRAFQLREADSKGSVERLEVRMPA